MNYGPLLFLAAFFALAGSWFGFILTPQVQLGRLQQTNTVSTAAIYPLARPGLARQGMEVYRANGCQYCHSQQVGQAGTVFEVVLSEAGTNQADVRSLLMKLQPNRSEAEVGQMLEGLPTPVLRSRQRSEANAAIQALGTNGAKALLWIVPVGPDLARGWGKRRSVAQDYLFDSPVMLGSLRAGPDLANVGVRQPDLNWHLRHLYSPRAEVDRSSMPAYPYLFERRKIQTGSSAQALVLKEMAPLAGYEIVPKPEALALAAYLVSLRADAPLFETPISTPSGTVANTQTNASGVVSNAPPTNAPAK